MSRLFLAKRHIYYYKERSQSLHSNIEIYSDRAFEICTPVITHHHRAIERLCCEMLRSLRKSINEMEFAQWRRVQMKCC